MAKSIRAGTKKRGRPKTTGKGLQIGVRLHKPALASLDAWIKLQPGPRPSRPEAIRLILQDRLDAPPPTAKGKRPGVRL